MKFINYLMGEAYVKAVNDIIDDYDLKITKKLQNELKECSDHYEIENIFESEFGFTMRYISDFREYAEDFLSEGYTIPDFLKNYIDYDSFAEDYKNDLTLYELEDDDNEVIEILQ